jgi:hypothetical protein
MARTPIQAEREPTILAILLQGLAMLLFCVGTLAAVWLALEAALAGRFDLVVAWQVGLAFLGGLVLTMAAWFAGHMVRQQAKALDAQRRLVGAIGHLIQVSPVPSHVQQHTDGRPGDNLPFPPRPVSPALEAQLLEQLRELNVNLLLSDSQKQLKRTQVLLPQAQMLAREAAQLAATGDVKAAWQSLQRLVQVAPDLPELEGLRANIEAAGRQVQARDIEQTRRWVRDFQAAGDFTAAESAAVHLLGEYPHSQEAMELLAQVRRERQEIEDDRRRKMYQHVEQEVAQKHWAGALAAAEQFTQAFSGTSEAENLTLQLATLRDNAAIEQARQLRDRIAELIAQRLFSQALALAQETIERFPHTAVAEELRQGLAKLDERAKLEELAKASS